MKKYLIFSIFYTLLFCEAVSGQTKQTPVKKTAPGKQISKKEEVEPEGTCIGITGKAINGRIYLRWIPAMQSYWEFGYKNGYMLERINVKTQQKVILNADILPAPSSQWKPFLEKKDRNYGLLHTAIFEKPEYSNDILAQMDERRQLYQFALLCADMDFKAATMAGLGYIDTTAIAGERYRYIIKHKIAPKFGLSATISEEIGTNDHIVLPTISHFEGHSERNKATLLMATQTLKQHYVQYRIERSTDTLNFQSISDLPIVSSSKLDTLMISDSLTENEIPYYYRIKGFTLFQEESPFSKTISVSGKAYLITPEFYTVKEIGKDTIEASWLYKDSLSQYVQKYQLVGSTEREGPYQVLADNIPPQQHFTQFKPVTPVRGFTFYIKLITYPKKGQKRETLPLPVVLADDTPPVLPKGLKGKIEVKGDLGIVSLSWDPNPDSDLLGYYLNRRDDNVDFYHRVNNSYTTETSMVDTIYLHQMQKYVRYTVKAIDFLFKESVDSEMLLLKIPDINPPTSPIIDSFAVEDRRILLHWTHSYSNDVVKHILYRKKLPDTPWEVVLTLPDTLRTAYIDSNIVEKSLYAYTMIAFDENDNQSEPANTVILETPFFVQEADFKQFTAELSDDKNIVRLVWQCAPNEKLENFMLYRASPGEDLVLVKKLDKSIIAWTDTIPIVPNQSYRYVIRARMKEGYLSGWQETIIEVKP